MSNTRVSLLPRVLMENVGKLPELSNCAGSVHTHTVHAHHQHFVNSFVYLNTSYGRQYAVRKEHEFWKVESDEKKDSILREAFWKLEMMTKRKITSYFRQELKVKCCFCIL